MKVKDIFETEVLEENIMQYPTTMSKLDNLVRFTILPLYFDELGLTKRECIQATQYILDKTTELLQKNNQAR